MQCDVHGNIGIIHDFGLRVNLVPYAADHPDKNFFDTLDDNCRLVESRHGIQDGRVASTHCASVQLPAAACAICSLSGSPLALLALV